ncbi:MAG: class IV adenylate cyclase [Nanoarchaeota archaeon]|nr:class IV adenylate cyclase [Nanoarchaeota archaeon]
MIETEAKIRLDGKDVNHIKCLIEIPEFVLQKNKIYFLDNGFLRIREEEGNNFLTFKGKKLNEKYNSREEIEVKVDNSQALENLLNSLGYNVNFYYEKMRAKFELNNCAVCLDKLSDEYYLEVEGSEKDISEVIDFFGLSNKPLEERSYQEIMQMKEKNKKRV